MDANVQYYKLNIYLLSSVGLWPYASKKIRRIQNICVSTFLWLGIIGQLGTFATIKHTVELLLGNVSFVIAMLCFFFKYNCFWFQLGTVKYVMEHIQHDWNALKDEEELRIIKEHARLGTYYTRLFALFLYPLAFAFILSPFVSDFLNVVVPLNESRSHQLLISKEAVIDVEKYFYVIVSMASIVILAGTTSLIATEGIFCVWLEHVAGMFEIVSYGLKQIVLSNSIQKKRFIRKSEVRTIANIIDEHLRALKFLDYLKHKFTPSYAVLLVFGVVSMSINLWHLSRLFDSPTDIGDLFFSCSIVIVNLIYPYCFNYLVERTTGLSHAILTESYNSRWYEVPVATQKMLLFIMQGNMRPPRFDFYGFYNSSVESFGTVYLDIPKSIIKPKPFPTRNQSWIYVSVGKLHSSMGRAVKHSKDSDVLHNLWSVLRMCLEKHELLTRMDAIMKHYKLNIYLLSSIGLWPYTNKHIRRIQNICISTFLWLGIVIQLGTFATFKHTVELFLENVPFILSALCFFFKYNCFWFQLGTAKHLMEQIRCDWDSLKFERELGIIKEHARMGTYYTRLFALLIYPPLIILMLSPFVPAFLNVVVPLNESRPHRLLVVKETLFDIEKYFYVFVILACFIILAGSTAVIATEGIFFSWLQHAAGMFEIVSYALKEIILPDLIKKKRFIRKSEVRTLGSIIEIHLRAIKFLSYLKRKLTPSYLVLLGFGVAALSINLLHLSRLFDSPIAVGELFFSGSVVMLNLVYMYSINYLVAQTIGFSDAIFTESYNTRWYDVPVATQKMLLFIMQGNMKSFSFDLYGFYNCTIESLGMVVRLSLSYFMVLRSI